MFLCQAQRLPEHVFVLQHLDVVQVLLDPLPIRQRSCPTPGLVRLNGPQDRDIIPDFERQVHLDGYQFLELAIVFLGRRGLGQIFLALVLAGSIRVVAFSLWWLRKCRGWHRGR